MRCARSRSTSSASSSARERPPSACRRLATLRAGPRSRRPRPPARARRGPAIAGSTRTVAALGGEVDRGVLDARRLGRKRSMRLTHEAQVIPSMGRTISIGRGSGMAAPVGVDILHRGVYRTARVSPISEARYPGCPASPGRATSPARSAAGRPTPRRRGRDLGRQRVDRKNGIDSVAPYAPTSSIATRSPGSGRAMTAAWREHVEPRAQRPGDGHREPLGVGAGPARRAGPSRTRTPMLLADQRRPQHVVDPAVEDHDVAARRRSCDRRPGAT